MRPFAVDANAIALFQFERISQAPGPGSVAVETITRKNCIALDDERLCLQEWIDSAQGKYPFALKDWVADMAVAGKIRYYPLAANDCRKHLLQLGMPKDDHKWVRLALGSGGRAIVTGDIDFFDPSMKKAKAEAKQKIIDSGRGPCSRALGKQYEIEVIHVAKVPMLEEV